MADIVNLAAAREERTPHMSGEARCQACGHRWVAVAPVGVPSLTCPSCESEKGFYMHPALAAGDQWECLCGCDVFRIGRGAGPYCVNCGVPAEGWVDA